MTPKPTRIDAFLTTDGELFASEEEAMQYEVTQNIEQNLRDLYKDLIRDVGASVTGTELLEWFKRNVRAIQRITTLLIDS